MDVAGSDDGALDADTLDNERQVWDREIALGNREGEDGAVGGHEREVEIPVCRVKLVRIRSTVTIRRKL